MGIRAKSANKVSMHSPSPQPPAFAGAGSSPLGRGSLPDRLYRPGVAILCYAKVVSKRSGTMTLRAESVRNHSSITAQSLIVRSAA